MRGILESLLLLIGLLRSVEPLVLAETAEADDGAPDTPPSFQTNSGYDVGGEDPICLISSFSNSSIGFNHSLPTPWLLTSDPSSPYANGSTPAHLLPKCPYNTSLELRGSFEPDYSQYGRVLFTGSTYSFQASFFTNILRAGVFTQPTQVSGVFLRVVMCNALKRGFCSPLIDFRSPERIEMPSINETRAVDGNRNGTSSFAAIQLTARENVKKRVIVSDSVHADYGHDDQNVTLDFELAVPANATTGTYLVISHAAMILEYVNGTSGKIQRLDVGASLPRFTVNVENPPNILTVSRGTKAALGVVSVIIGLSSLLMVAFMVKHRKHAVMRLAQGSFLIGLAACIATSSTFMFTYMPTQDIFCSMRGFLVDVPFTATAAIILARCWRVHLTLSLAHVFARRSAAANKLSLGRSIVIVLTWFARLPFRLCRCLDTNARAATSHRGRSASLRQKVTARETLSLVTILSLPSLCLQIICVSLYKPQLYLEFNEQTNTGREVCLNESQYIQQASIAWTGLILLSAVVLAWDSRNLPSAFNEKNAIFNTASVSAVILFVTLMLAGMTDSEDTPPDVVVFLRCLNYFGPAVAMLINLVLPKIRRVRSGEKVVLTRLLKTYEQGSYGEKTDSNNMNNRFSSQVSRPAFTSGDVIKLRRYDPLPPQLENEIYSVQDVLSQVTRLCAEGRTPSEEEWNAIFRTVSKLKMDLDRVQLDFHDSSIISGSPERNRKEGLLVANLAGEGGNGNSNTNAFDNDKKSTSNPAVEVPLGNGTVTDQPSDLESKETSDEQPPTGDEERVESIDAI